jgi:hypothetical protein
LTWPPYPFKILSDLLSLKKVVAQVGGQVRGVGQEFFEVVPGGIVEREPGDLAELRVEVLKFLVAQLRLFSQHLLLGGGQHAVETA